jgi:hypothetical protein
MKRVYQKAARQDAKVCAGCSAEKPAEEFYATGAGRLRSRCKACYAEHNRQQRAKHSEKRNAYDASRGTGWDRSGREKYETKEKKMDGYYERTYGITEETYQQMLADQGGVCAICQQECNRSTTERLCVDHDHATGYVRGLLCFKCNTGLGRFNDDLAFLSRAIDYLRRAQAVERKTLFLCGPMSGLPKNNYPAFMRAAKSLRASGYLVQNPAENPEPPCKTWAGYMRMSLAQLVRCEMIALLPGWENSRGAKLEWHIAQQLGMRPIYVNLGGEPCPS